MSYIIDEKYNGFSFRMEEIDGLYLIRIYDENDRRIGRCKGNVLTASLNGAKVKAMAIGAVFIEPEFRRFGLAKHCFELLDRIIKDTGCLVSYLHPFSFNYYRMFGYERIADHRIIEFPIEKLDFIPRYHDLERICLEDGTKDLELAHNRFCLKRNAIFLREGTLATTEPTICSGYTNGGPFTYDFSKGILYYLSRDENGSPNGYIMFRKELRQEHHHLFGTIHVDEIVFDSMDVLRRLLGFIRMYDGEADNVIFHNVGMAPEVELVLRDYKYIRLTSVPDLCARFHDVATLLESFEYPDAPGSFTLRVTDCEKSPFSKDLTYGAWRVDYKDGKGTITKLDNDFVCDIEANMPAITQLIHGFMSYGLCSALYCDGVKINGKCEDFFRAFPNRPCGMTDLF